MDLASIEPLLVAEIRRFRRRTWARGAVTLAIILGGAVLFGALALSRREAMDVARLAAVLGLPLIVVLAVLGLRNPAQHPCLRALRTRLDRIVWVYVRLYHGASRMDELVFAFDDGTTASLPVDPESSTELLVRVAPVFRLATIGFSKEAADTFLRAPPKLRRSTPQPVGLPGPIGEAAWLIPYAATTFRARRAGGVCGVLLVLLGAAAMALVAAAASPRDQPALLMAIFAGVAVLPGVLLIVWGFARFDKSELAIALRAPGGRVRSLQYTHGPDVEGDLVRTAVVTLTNGRTFVFRIPNAPPSSPERT